MGEGMTTFGAKGRRHLILSPPGPLVDEHYDDQSSSSKEPLQLVRRQVHREREPDHGFTPCEANADVRRPRLNAPFRRNEQFVDQSVS